MAKPTPLVAGNWKMNGLNTALAEIEALSGLLGGKDTPACDVMICPPATLLSRLADAADGSSIAVGGQDCHQNVSGAHTGDISAQMLKDAGASAVIVGHSERRADHGESDKTVHDKAVAAWDAGLKAIICVGETESQRDAGETIQVVEGQLAGSIPEGATADNMVVAYEPVWAIGTGRTPTVDDVAAVHAAMRAALEARFGAETGGSVALLYGGSVKPGNAVELMGVANVNGALVGGASLKAADFDGIIDAYRG